MPGSSTIGLALGLVLAAACSGDEPGASDPPDERSAHVDLFLDPDIRACGHQLEAYDKFIERIFDFWTGDDPGDFRIDVHVLQESRCPGGALVCADPWGVYLANQFQEYHELVHAMHFATDGTSAPSIVEGLATALGPGAPHSWTPGEGYEVDVLFKSSSTATDYGAYGVFTRFLLDRYGAEPYRAYFRGMTDPEDRAPEDFEREFELAFGEGLDLAWSAFVGESRCAYDFWYCDERRPVELPFVLDGIDCDDRDALGYEGPIQELPNGSLYHPWRPTRIVHLDNPEPRTVRVEFESVSIDVGRCGDCSEQRPPMFAGFNLDVVNLSASDQRFVEDLELEAGSYVFIVKQPPERSAWFSIIPVD